MKKIWMVCLLLVGVAFILEAVEIRVSIAMDESQPYQKELRYYIVKAIADLEDVKIVEPGQGEWFRVQVLVFEMRLENQLEVGYSIGYSILEVPFYLHSFILEGIDPEKINDTTKRLIESMVFFHGSNLITVGKEGLEFGAEQISSSLKETMKKRIRTQSE